MPIAAIFLGVILVDLAFRGTEHEFAKQVGHDFGSGSQFYAWAAAIVVLGALGYVPAIGRLSNLLLALVVVVLVLKNGGLFTNLANVILHPPAAAPAISISKYASGSSSSSAQSSSSSSSSGSGIIGEVGAAVGLIASLA